MRYIVVSTTLRGFEKTSFCKTKCCNNQHLSFDVSPKFLFYLMLQVRVDPKVEKRCLFYKKNKENKEKKEMFIDQIFQRYA